MKLNSIFLGISATFLILITACNKELDTSRNKETDLNNIQEFPKLKKLVEIDNYELKEQLPNTLWLANKILDSLADNRFLFDNYLTIDSSHIYEIVKQSQPHSYFFNLIPTNNDTKKFMVQLVSLRIDLDLNSKFENRLYIYSNSSKAEKVIRFNQVGKIINEHEKNTNVSQLSNYIVPSQSQIYFYPGSIFSFPSSNYPGGFSSPYVVMAAPHNVLLQFAQTTGNWALAANLGYIMANTTPCNTSFCQQIYNPPPPTLNRTLNDLAILNPVTTYPHYIPPPSYTLYNNYYFPNGYFSSLKDEIATYYKTVWVSQANFFTTSNSITDAEHIKKQTFVTSFFEWLYNLNYESIALYNYLRDNPNATSKLFKFLADINLNGSNFVFINNGYADYSQDKSAKFINWFAQRISVDYSLLQKYANNQISKNQFIDYYKRIFEFESGLSYSQALFLKENPSYQKPLYDYLSKNYSSESVQIGKEHIELLMSNPEYEQFVNNHGTTGNSEIVWWIDDIWLDNPNNFNLDIDRAYDHYDQFADLNVQEKALVAAFPVQAYTIKENIQTAFEMTDSKMGANGGLNDKKDAFRHAFFQAINTRDVPARLTPTFVSASAIVTLFSNAHESEVPAPLLLEKQMDLYNNAVGISYCWNCWTTSDNNIADAIILKLNNGELRYISPIDRLSSRIFDANRDGIQDCPTCLNGIIPISVLIPTNQ